MSKKIKHKDLSLEEKKIIKSKKVSGKKKLNQWLKLLKSLSDFDSFTDQQRDKFKLRGILFFVGAFIGCFATVYVTTEKIYESIHLSYILGGVTVFSLILAIFFGIRALMLGRIDLTNDFRETLLPLINILSEDIMEKEKIYISLNMENPVQKKYRISKKKIPPGRNLKVIETVYEITSCSAEFPLINGTVLSLEIKKDFISYDRSYKSARGKYKSKRKWKQLSFAEAALFPSVNEFSFDDEQVSVLQNKEKLKYKLKKGAPLCRLSRKFKDKTLQQTPERYIEPEVIIEMFMSLCAMLKPADKKNNSGSN